MKQVGAVEGAPGEVQGRKWEEMNEAHLKELEAPGEEWGMVMQVWEQNVSATDEALSDLKGEWKLGGKRKRGDELVRLPVRHSLWEQGSLEGYNEVLLGCLDSEVGALRQRRAE